MSSENVKLFANKIQSNESLQAKIKNIESEDNQIQLSKLVELAEEEGYPFTIEHLQQSLQAAASKQSIELDDKELEAVAGGSSALNWFQVSVHSTFIGCLVSLTAMASREDDCLI